MEVHDVVQERGIKTIPKKKKCKEANGLPEEALQIAVKRREAKSKGEKERYTHLSALPVQVGEESLVSFKIRSAYRQTYLFV